MIPPDAANRIQLAMLFGEPITAKDTIVLWAEANALRDALLALVVTVISDVELLGTNRPGLASAIVAAETALGLQHPRA